jgi:hypothetical protein
LGLSTEENDQAHEAGITPIGVEEMELRTIAKKKNKK